MKVAVIDVGFNSLKMVKYKVEPDGDAKSYGQLGMMAKLGEGLEKTGYLGNEPISRTIDALRLCKETTTLESMDHVLLVGTSPFREAANREELLKRIQEETGLKMRVLTGNEEALYGVLGALRSVDGSNVLFFDLGGGSLELTYTENYKVRRILSLPLGALKLTSMYADKDGRFSRKDRSKLAKRIALLLPSRRELELDKDTVLVGTGGTVRAMARFDQGEVGYPFDKVHNYTVGEDSVQRMSRRFFKLKKDELAKVEAIGEGRAETIAAGTLIVRTLMKRMDFDRMTVSTHGLRDGILTEFLEGGVRSPAGIVQKEDLERLLARPEPATDLAGDVDLLECLARNGLIDDREMRILLTGVARGRSPDCIEADPGALFGILMNEDLPMSHEDQLLLAVSLVRARRPRTANWLARKYSEVLADDPREVRKLGSCLRLLEVLDRSGTQFRVAYSGGLRISLIGSKGPFPMEVARNAALLFSSAIRKPVTIFASAKERERHAGLVKAES